MRTLIVGIGALGGVIATRLLDAGAPVSLATRDTASARALQASGLRVGGVGGSVVVPAPADVAAIDAYGGGARFDLVLLATKAHEAIALAPQLASLLTGGGVLLPIQNGGVSQLLDARIPGRRVLGGLSNLGATMISPGVYEQRNAGYLLLGEIGGDGTARPEQVRRWLGQAVDVRVSTNMTGAIWSKLLLNCSVTTLGAIAGLTMREYITLPRALDVFERVYDEALSVAVAAGVQPERMLVDPVPPGWPDRSVRDHAYEAWVCEILNAYGDLKPSMLQDFERGRTTEIDFINGYVVDRGRALTVPTPINAAIVRTVQAITRGELAPHPERLSPRILLEE